MEEYLLTIAAGVSAMCNLSVMVLCVRNTASVEVTKAMDETVLFPQSWLKTIRLRYRQDIAWSSPPKHLKIHYGTYVLKH